MRLLTGSRFADAVRATGAEFQPLPSEADWDDRDFDASFPERRGKKGIAAVRFDVTNVFIALAPYQFRMVERLLDQHPTDAILGDAAFGGLLALIMRREPRPPLIVLGVLPLTLSSIDTAPYRLALAPSASPLGRLRNRALNALMQRVLLRPITQKADELLVEMGLGNSPIFLLDWYRLAGPIRQCTVAEFEYPRSDLGRNVTFAGPLLAAAPPFPTPDWWEELDEARPVVHVTQGTLDNADLSKLIEPAIQGLAGQDLLVVVATGGRPAASLGLRLPDNVRVAEMLPYAELLARTDVMVTNGGYGGVQLALAHGVPLVVAGDSEDKPEVAARVAWSGAGINLRTGRPRPEKIAKAVEHVLNRPRYRLVSLVVRPGDGWRGRYGGLGGVSGVSVFG